MQKPFQLGHVKRKRLIIPHTDSVEKEVTVFFREPLFKCCERVFRDHIEMQVRQLYRSRSVLRWYIALDLDRLDLDRQNVFETATPAT